LISLGTPPVVSKFQVLHSGLWCILSYLMYGVSSRHQISFFYFWRSSFHW
jgi:hypothetical protein